MDQITEYKTFAGLVSSMTFEDILKILIYEMERNSEENKKQSKKVINYCAFLL